MKDITWEMDEHFFFPNDLGAVTEVQSLKISPQWVSAETNNSKRLDGIYHFAVKVAFNDAEAATLQKGAYIEELDLEQNVGYFEYALPFAIDLPDTAGQLDGVKVSVEGQKSAVLDGGCQVKWHVRCQFEEHAAEQEIIVNKDDVPKQTAQLNPIPDVQVILPVPEMREVIINTEIQEVKESIAFEEQKEIVAMEEQKEILVMHEEKAETVVMREENEVAEIVDASKPPKQLESQMMSVPADDFYQELSEAYKVHQVIIPKAKENQS